MVFGPSDYTMRRVGPLGFSVSVSTAGPSGRDSKVRVRSTLDRFGLPGMELAASSEPGRAPHVDPSRLRSSLTSGRARIFQRASSDEPARRSWRACETSHRHWAGAPMNCAGATGRSTVCLTSGNATATAPRSALAPAPCNSSRCAPDPSSGKGAGRSSETFSHPRRAFVDTPPSQECRREQPSPPTRCFHREARSPRRAVAASNQPDHRSVHAGHGGHDR